MNSEQVKVEQFFDRVLKNSTAKGISWCLTGLFLFIIMILCMLPAQEIFVGDLSPIIPGVLAMLTIMMIFFRSAMYDQYNENQKSRFMAAILMYHPINKKEIWKHKTKKIAVFLAKVTVVGLVFQLLVALIAYKSISWLNFFYIIIGVFGFPIVGVLTFDLIVKQMEGDLGL